MSDSSLARERLLGLLDADSFVELGALVQSRTTDFNTKPKKESSDGVITGYGLIEGSPVYVFSQDPQVLGGSMGEMHLQKIIRLYGIAVKTGAPVIGLLDSGGLRLEEGQDGLEAMGRLAGVMAGASGIIPQIIGIFGNAGGGLSVLTGLADFVFMEEEKGRLFVNAPDTIKGNAKDKTDNGSAEFQASETPNVDFTGPAEEVYAAIRSLTALLPSNNEDREKSFPTGDDPNRLIPEGVSCAKDAALLLSALADDGEFFELKAGYAKHMVAGFIRINGQLVGAFGNRSEVYDENGEKKESFDQTLYPKGVEKAVRLIRFCDAFEIPLLSLVNVTGFHACLNGEKSHIEKTSSLISAYAAATVPKVVLITEKAISSAALAMGSKTLGADLCFAWEDALIGPMEAEMAEKVLAGKEQSGDYRERVLAARHAAERGYVDALISPEASRKHLSYAFELLYSKVDAPDKKHGTR